MAFLLMLGVKHGPVIAAVVIDLQGIGADQNLGGANKSTESALITLQHLVITDLGIVFFRCIAGHDHQHRNLLFVITPDLCFISQSLEDQPLIQRPETGTDITKVVGGADDQTVRIPNLFKDRSQTILADALTQIVWQLAAKAGQTTSEFL